MVQITLKIDGMKCGMCESHVNDTIRNNFPVKKVTSSHTKGETIILAKEGIDEQALRTVLDPTGYKVMEVSEVPYEEKQSILKTISNRFH